MTEAKNIIEHKVYNIIKVKKKYGFRVKCQKTNLAEFDGR